MCDAVKEMEEIIPFAVQHFKKYDVNVFCKSKFKSDTKCDVIVSNMVKTFNNYVMRARSKHFIDMLGDKERGSKEMVWGYMSKGAGRHRQGEGRGKQM